MILKRETLNVTYELVEITPKLNVMRKIDQTLTLKNEKHIHEYD